ncbi:outer membrane protein with beta-barrel domain [Spirosoma oryzae]|uniref:Outer membrane protein with beta-barrel domain n=1 Tax=Spirosoma oryzae TaxID=1469603 RepID=A0A2T0RP65_9BACT|nr:outer membrane beta-barrel protein [Spirosoma oryzae]PRY22941.1 outer membrane protein with beta-barrel domain [Spirosoma oryzae]
MKSLLLPLLLLGLVTLSFGQKTFILSMQDKKAFVSVAGGVSLPLGTYSHNATDRKSMCAGPGLVLNLSAGYRVLDRVGLMVRAEQHRNIVKTNAMVDAMGTDAATNWTAEAGDWSVTTIMAGPYITIPKGRFSFDGRLLAGWARATMPETQMNGTYGPTPVSIQTVSSQSSALAMGGGTSARYRLNPWLSAHVNADFSYAVLTFNNLSTRAWSANGSSEMPYYSSDRQICTMGVSAGLTLLLVNSNRPF